MQTPEKGFYYHYKHDPQGEKENNYTYEVVGVGLHTEDRTYTVVYRPLYKNTFLEGADYCVRPLEMFMGTVEKDNKTVSRFVKITDEKIISELEKIRDEMYK